MATAMEAHIPVTVDALTVDLAQWLVVQFYLERLTRLLQLTVADIPTLSAEEQQRLRTQAIVGTIEMLTTLGAGSCASHLLRTAPRWRGHVEPCLPRAILSGNASPDSKRAA